MGSGMGVTRFPGEPDTPDQSYWCEFLCCETSAIRSFSRPVTHDMHHLPGWHAGACESSGTQPFQLVSNQVTRVRSRTGLLDRYPAIVHEHQMHQRLLGAWAPQRGMHLYCRGNRPDQAGSGDRPQRAAVVWRTHSKHAHLKLMSCSGR